MCGTKPLLREKLEVGSSFLIATVWERGLWKYYVSTFPTCFDVHITSANMVYKSLWTSFWISYRWNWSRCCCLFSVSILINLIKKLYFYFTEKFGISISTFNPILNRWWEYVLNKFVHWLNEWTSFSFILSLIWPFCPLLKTKLQKDEKSQTIGYIIS